MPKRSPAFRVNRGNGGIKASSRFMGRAIKKAHGRPRKEQPQTEETTFTLITPGEMVWNAMMKESW